MSAPVRRRTRARELALQFLYKLEVRGADAFEELEAFLEHHTKGGELKGRDDVAAYAAELCRGVHAHRPEIDAWIEAIAENWRLSRMATVDRNVLRLATWELLHQSEVPYKVVINEAIEIAKRYSTAQSGAFANGILDRTWVLIERGRAASGLAVPPPPSADEVLAVRRRVPGDPEAAPGAPAAEPAPAPVPRPRPRPRPPQA
jgi:transcription antitermination factor NusB